MNTGTKVLLGFAGYAMAGFLTYGYCDVAWERSCDEQQSKAPKGSLLAEHRSFCSPFNDSAFKSIYWPIFWGGYLGREVFK